MYVARNISSKEIFVNTLDFRASNLCVHRRTNLRLHGTAIVLLKAVR